MSTATASRFSQSRRFLTSAALLTVLAACNLDGGEVASTGASYTAASLRYAARSDADHPAWGNPRWSMQYAYNGRCDDPGYRTSNGGEAEAGSDEHDCARFGDGLK